MAKRKAKRGQPSGQASHSDDEAHAGREAQRTKGGSHKAHVVRRRPLPNWPVLVLALLGMALTAYLSATSWLSTAPAYCGPGGGCHLVQSSRWGKLLGLPTAFWGFLAYATLAHIAYRVRNAERHWKFSWVIAAVGLAVSLYLTAVAELVIQATCFYCITSLALMAALFVVITVQWPRGMERFSWPVWTAEVGALAIVVVVALFMNYSGVFNPAMGPEDPYLKGLAQHLSEQGDVFYGAFW